MSVYKYNNKTWFCRYRLKDYKGNFIQITKAGFKTKADAIKYERQQLVNYNILDKQMFFKDVFNVFILECKKIYKVSTIEGFKYINDKYFIVFNNKDISKIKLLDVVSFQNDLLNKLSIERVNKIISVLRKVYIYAYQNNIISDNIMLKVSNSRSFEFKERKVDFYTYEEFKVFISSFPTDVNNSDYVFTILFYILYFTGLRTNEALALRFSDYRVNDNVLSITKSLVRSKGKILVLKPKTSSSIGDVYLNKLCVVLLQNYLKNLKRSKCDYLFQKNGKLISKRTLENKNRFYAKKSNIRKIRLHDFRHSFASYVYNEFGSFDIVGKLLRHKNSEQAIKTYVHIFPKKLDNVISTLILKEKL